MTPEERSAAADADAALIAHLRATVEMKDHLLQMVSHEMRTPLISISNFSTTILASWASIPDEEKREYLTIINDQATRLSRLVNDLLAVARMESGRLRTIRERVSLHQIARETVSELMPDSESVQVDCPEDLFAVADRDHVKQILVNFVSNALKYGDAPISIQGAPASSGDSVQLWVQDHGPGVSKSFEPHLFEKFAQASDDHQRVGSGLGLAIVEGLAHAQGGRAWYARADGAARFGVDLPDA